jgi:hypothetical protein
MKPLFAVLVLTAGCISTPVTTVRTPDSRPGLAIEGAPSGATLYIDGNAVGAADAFNGAPAVLRVEPGTHEVDVRDAAGKVLFSQRVFVESETKTIQVH